MRHKVQPLSKGYQRRSFQPCLCCNHSQQFFGFCVARKPAKYCCRTVSYLAVPLPKHISEWVRGFIFGHAPGGEVLKGLVHLSLKRRTILSVSPILHTGYGHSVIVSLHSGPSVRLSTCGPVMNVATLQCSPKESKVKLPGLPVPVPPLLPMHYENACCRAKGQSLNQLPS